MVTGGRKAQLEKIGLALHSKPCTQEHKGMTFLGSNVKTCKEMQRNAKNMMRTRSAGKSY